MKQISQIALTDIDPEDRLTDFSLDGCPEKLMDSIKEIGIRHPISVYPGKKGHILISGHKRFQAAPRCGLTHIPAFIIPEIDDASRLALNLNENFGQRNYSAIEKGRILNKLSHAEINDETIIKDYMPLLELERSKKIFSDLSGVGTLSFELQKLLHDAAVPVKTFRIFYRWEPESRRLAENLFSQLEPGVNKWRELLELIDEIAVKENTAPGEILSRDDIKKILGTSEIKSPQKYDPIQQILFNLRYPVLSDMRKQVACALDAMQLDDKTRLRFEKTFESDELKLELKFQSEKELSQQVEKIFKALQSGSVEKLIKIFQPQIDTDEQR
jgi:ParB/RepB/Spo0J family partition protein